MLQMRNGTGRSICFLLTYKLDFPIIQMAIDSSAHETVLQLPFCHSVQAKRDTESSIISNFWIPAFAGMTILRLFSFIATQSHMPELFS